MVGRNVAGPRLTPAKVVVLFFATVIHTTATSNIVSLVIMLSSASIPAAAAGLAQVIVSFPTHTHNSNGKWCYLDVASLAHARLFIASPSGSVRAAWHLWLAARW